MHNITTQKIFDYTVCRILCENKELYKNKELTNSVQMVFDSPVVKYRVRQVVGDSHKSGGYTSVGQPYPLIDLPGAAPLVDWLSEQFLKVKPKICPNKTGNKILYKRSWSNVMQNGSYGSIHNHTKIDNYISLAGYESKNFRPDAVGVLYVNVPENSSNLVFVKNKKGVEDQPVEYFVGREDIYWLNPTEGEFVIHSPNVWHGVSKHNNELPRIVFVFDIDYVD